MRLLIVTWTLLVILTSCTSPYVPAVGSGKPTNTPVDIVAPEATAPAVNGAFETSLLATRWTGGSEGSLLYPMDPNTGTALPGYAPISLGHGYFYAFSPDRQILAAVSFPNDNAYNGNLLLIDLPAWKAREFELKLDGWARTMVFSPGGESVAIAHGESTYKLTLFNLEQGAIVAQQETGPLVTHMKFTADGKSIMVYGSRVDRTKQMSGGPPQIQLLDAVDLSPRWSAELEAVREGIFPLSENVTPDNMHEPGQALYLSPGVVFAPDREALYIVHADSNHLTSVDFGAQEVETVEIRSELSWFERVLSLGVDVAYAKIGDGTSKQIAISPDGEILYVVGSTNATFKDKQGNWQMKQTPLGLEIIRTKDGSRVERFESDAFELSLSPDGRFLYLRNWGRDAPRTEIFDTGNRQFVTRKEWIFAVPALCMNGEYLLVSTFSTGEFTHHMSVLRPDDLGVLTDWSGPDYVSWLTAP